LTCGISREVPDANKSHIHIGSDSRHCHILSNHKQTVKKLLRKIHNSRRCSLKPPWWYQGVWRNVIGSSCYIIAKWGSSECLKCFLQYILNRMVVYLGLDIRCADWCHVISSCMLRLCFEACYSHRTVFMRN
jgi:hypothetical protein